MDLNHSKKITTAGLLITLGIIFGDIGTSPLYTFQTIMNEGGNATKELVLGAISCVFWTLTLQTTFKYVLLTLQADNKGEGGVFRSMHWSGDTGRNSCIRRSLGRVLCWPMGS